MDMTTDYRSMKRWFQVLLICHSITIGISLLGLIPALGGVLNWISRGLAVAGVVALFGLGKFRDRYRTAAILNAAAIGGNLLSLILRQNLLTMGLSICAIVASWFELTGHSQLTQSFDGRLSRKWHNLFYWELGVGLLSGFFSVVAVIIAVLAQVDTEVLTHAVVAAISICNAALGLARVIYLKKTIPFLEEDPFQLLT